MPASEMTGAHRLTDSQRRRYSRQIALPSIGAEGQARLLESHVLLVGCGALGASLAALLVRAGVGQLTIVDRDFVEPSNLQRQGLFDESDASEALPKAEAARRRLRAINSDVSVRAVVDDFNAGSAERILDAGDVAPDAILDGVDNFRTRYLLNDLCVARLIPYVHAGVVGLQATQMTILPRSSKPARWEGFESPCLRCVFPDPPPPGAEPTCETAGVLNAAVSAVTGFQASETIKILTGDYRAVARGLLAIDMQSASTRRIDTGAPVAECPSCGRRRFEFLDAEADSQMATLCGRNSVQILPSEGEPVAPINLEALARRLSSHGDFRATRFMLRGSLEHERTEEGEPIELAIFPNGRAIITGVNDAGRARTLYAQYVGE